MADHSTEPFWLTVSKAGMFGGLAGSAMGAVGAAWTEPAPHSVGIKTLAKKTFRTMGLSAGTVGFCAAGFVAGEGIAASVRSKDDHWNGVIGGFIAGIPLGLRSASFAGGVGVCTALAAASYAVHYYDYRFMATRSEQLETYAKIRDEVRAREASS
mmetsp:Transcript_19419/g.45422  ORF Transcript_19419/g.45422 Transcript_19419/m.45422 type:complete len:156 (+) Transcript_19419:22-489(+)